MKTSLLILIASLTLATQAFAGPRKMDTLANPSDFVVLSNVNTSSQTIMLSYTGETFDHCGIAIRGHSFVVNSEKLLNLIDVTVGDEKLLAPVIDQRGRISFKLEGTDQPSFGAFFTIRTKSGESLEKVLASLNPSTQVDAIVEILSCK